MDNATQRGVTVSEDCISFGNLVTSGPIVGKKEIVRAQLPLPSSAFERSNARGDLREIDGFESIGVLGIESATEFLATIRSNC